MRLSGAASTYGYERFEAIGKHVDLVSRGDKLRVRQELQRAATEGHFGTEFWHARQDGSRFWANVITMALTDSSGGLQGLRRSCAISANGTRSTRSCAAVAHVSARYHWNVLVPGILSGEFDGIPEANDAFLAMVAYSREDLMAGRAPARSHFAGVLCA